MCYNSMDDDMDGVSDCGDPDCFSVECYEVCDDGLDNNLNESTDCDEYTCMRDRHCNEAMCMLAYGDGGGSADNECCTNGIDDDNDGQSDIDDLDCRCSNGVDDDEDSFTDCGDPDCLSAAICSFPG